MSAGGGHTADSERDYERDFNLEWALWSKEAGVAAYTAESVHAALEAAANRTAAQTEAEIGTRVYHYEDRIAELESYSRVPVTPERLRELQAAEAERDAALARVAGLTAGVFVAPTNLEPSMDPPAPGGPAPIVNAHAASEAECMALAKRGTYWRDERERIGVQLVAAEAERDAALKERDEAQRLEGSQMLAQIDLRKAAEDRASEYDRMQSRAVQRRIAAEQALTVVGAERDAALARVAELEQALGEMLHHIQMRRTSIRADGTEFFSQPILGRLNSIARAVLGGPE